MTYQSNLEQFKAAKLEGESYETQTGKPVSVIFIGHSSIAFLYDNVVIYADPFSKVNSFTTLPKADYILITHEHFDHFDDSAIRALKKSSTKIYVSGGIGKKQAGGVVVAPGQHVNLVQDISFDTVPAYNITKDHLKFHPKDRKDVGYVLVFGKAKIFIPGDSEDIPEYATLPAFQGLSAAFLPINQPYTMTPAQAASAAKTLKTPVLYPSHGNASDFQKTKDLLAGSGINVIIKSYKPPF